MAAGPNASDANPAPLFAMPGHDALTGTAGAGQIFGLAGADALGGGAAQPGGVPAAVLRLGAQAVSGVRLRSRGRCG